MQTYELYNQVQIPVIGFGTWKLAEGQECYDAVKSALECGYRHVDTAQVYGNETSVGSAIKDSGIKREEIFLTTKIWNTHTSYEATMASFEESLDKLQTDYVDLLLIHWPNPQPIRDTQGYQERNAQVWRAMEDLYEAGKAKAIGVSNFRQHHLQALFETAKVKPMVNQIKLTPGLTEDDLVDYCRKHHILLEAYSPLGQGAIFEHEIIIEMAENYGKTPAQIALAWSLAKGFLPLPRSRNPKNIESNLDIFDFTLSDKDMEILDQLEGAPELSDPDQVDF